MSDEDIMATALAGVIGTVLLSASVLLVYRGCRAEDV